MRGDPFGHSRREVDGREGHVSREAGSGTAVQSEQSERLDDLCCAKSCGARHLGVLALHLQADLDNLERVGEDLEQASEKGSVTSICYEPKPVRARRTTWQPPARPPASNSHESLMRPVSLSVAYSRTRSLTVSLIAFSGATPCVEDLR